MYFKNDKIDIEILVGGYTDSPESYSEEIGKNALSCQVVYSGEDMFDGVLWDELFQTNGIISLYNEINMLLSEETNQITYRDEWNYFTFNALRKSNDKYEIYIKIIQKAEKEDLTGTFEYTVNELKELAEELKCYMNLYPVVK